MKKISNIFMIALAVIFCVSSAKALPDQANVWGASGAVTGNWNTAANWEVYTLDAFFGDLVATGTYAVPTSADVAQVWAGLVQVDGAVNATVVGIQTSSGNIEVTGGTLNVSGIGGPEGYENFDIARGIGASSTLTVSGGTINMTGSRFNIAKSGDTVQGVTGVLNQSGGAINADILAIGEIAYDDATANGYTTPWPAMAGSGAYNMTGGTLSASTLSVGKGIDGTMSVSAPAQITGSANVLVGAQDNVNGQFNIDGATVSANYIRIGNTDLSSGSAAINDASVTLTDNLIVALKGSAELEISGSSVVSCNRIYVADGANTTGSFEMTGGNVSTSLVRTGYGANSEAEVALSGGNLTTSTTCYMGQGVDSVSTITVSGDAGFFPAQLRMGWAAGSVTTLVIEGGAFESDYIICPENTTGASIVKVIGSDPNRIILDNGRLQLRNSPNSAVHFVFDNGGITPIQVLNDAVPLGGTTESAPKIYLGVTDDFDSDLFNVGDSFDLITTAGAYTIDISNAEIVNTVAGYIDFDVQVVSGDVDGQVLRATITNIDNTCEGQIAAGHIIPGDLNTDCVVNIDDLAIMAGSWLICYDPQGCN